MELSKKFCPSGCTCTCSFSLGPGSIVEEKAKNGSKQPKKEKVSPAAAILESEKTLGTRLNHGTIEPKMSNRSRIWSAAGWCPAAINSKPAFLGCKGRNGGRSYCDGTRSKLVGQFPSFVAIFFFTTEICGRPRKQLIKINFAGKPVLKIILYRKGLTQGYSTYGGSK